MGRTKALREGKDSKFRTYKKEVEKKRRLEIEWQQKMKDKFSAGADEKQVVAQNKER